MMVSVVKNRIPEELVNEIITRNDIVEVISEYLPLQPGGANHSALCPFHNEKTPSFMVSREKQLYKCFGCGQGGNVLRFVMEKENLDFIEALKKLAQRIHVDIPEGELTPEAKKQFEVQHLLIDMHREAAAFFFRCLKVKNNAGAAYLSKRGWSISTIKHFGIGYAPDQWDALCKHLKQKGYTYQQMEQAGLAIKRDKTEGYYDRFRNRVMFPIFDLRGNIVAFGGRILTAEGVPKYLNSPETPVFNKRHLLYGLNIARTQLVNKTLILVEGYTDVITLYENGFMNSAATLGTSLTADHARVVEKMAEEVLLCFDGDQAGVQAAQRAIRIFRDTGLRLKILTLPIDSDPDQFIREKGRDRFERLLQSAPSAVDYQLSLVRQKHSMATVEGKVRFAREAAVVLKQIKGSVEMEAYAAKVAEEIGISKEALMDELQGSRRKGYQAESGRAMVIRGSRTYEAMPPIDQPLTLKAEIQLLKWLLIHPEEIDAASGKINDHMFCDPSHQVIYRMMLEHRETLKTNKNFSDLFAGFEEELANIETVSNHELPEGGMIERFVEYSLIQQYEYQLQQLKLRQNQLLDSVDMDPGDKEDEMLLIGIEIRQINIELQQMFLRKGGKANG
jgi:DNA primase